MPEKSNKDDGFNVKLIGDEDRNVINGQPTQPTDSHIIMYVVYKRQNFKGTLKVILALMAVLLIVKAIFCAYNMRLSSGLFLALQDHSIDTKHSQYKCNNINDKDKFESVGWGNKLSCVLNGLCWGKPDLNDTKSSFCYYPKEFQSYKFINISASDMGAVAYLKIVNNSTFPSNVALIRMDFNYWTDDTLQIKIYDPVSPRYEPPFPELPSMGTKAAKNTKYIVKIDKEKFGFQIIRKSNKKIIFDAQNVGGFIFADQMLQISARLPSKYLYGLGQQRNNFSLDVNWKKITLFNHDQAPVDNSNLYGSHPFYLAMEDGGISNGVLLLNSNAMDILLTPAPAITYRTIGGVLDFFFFLGPSPTDVLRQNTKLVGRPNLPPYWSLGFHLCKFGYGSLDKTIEVWNRTRAAGIPFDTQWNDLDYMEEHKDFSYDKERFSKLPKFVDQLHQLGMHYMILIDPGISAGELPGTYAPYDEGIARRIFVTDLSGYRPFIGKVWNTQSTVFVDFFKTTTVTYWIKQLRELHEKFEFDGAWIDMNDPSNFLDGSITGCPNTTLDRPPYVPAVAGGRLYHRTLCMSARHGDGLLHYNVHNLYGLAEALVTNFAMQQIRKKRGFVISRSSFPGHGRYAGVWTGDIDSSWDDMAHSISDVLSFGLFGIPMSGADICGFRGDSTPELCLRWSQLGAFYPFARNHNSDTSKEQDPVALGPAVVAAARKALLTRYSLLPYLYTLLWHAHNLGDTVARPMFVQFPEDNSTYGLNAQFMWGSALLIAPVLKQGETTVEVYLPKGRWFDFYSLKEIHTSAGYYTANAPLDGDIPLVLHGGNIVVTQRPELTTTHSRTNCMDLLVVPNATSRAHGELYWDDGDSQDHNDGIYNHISFDFIGSKLNSNIALWRYTNVTLTLSDIKFLGVDKNPDTVTVNGNKTGFEYLSDAKVLHIKNLFLDISKEFAVLFN